MRLLNVYLKFRFCIGLLVLKDLIKDLVQIRNLNCYCKYEKDTYTVNVQTRNTFNIYGVSDMTL